MASSVVPLKNMPAAETAGAKMNPQFPARAEPACGRRAELDVHQPGDRPAVDRHRAEGFLAGRRLGSGTIRSWVIPVGRVFGCGGDRNRGKRHFMGDAGDCHVQVGLEDGRLASKQPCAFPVQTNEGVLLVGEYDSILRGDECSPCKEVK